jgi:hypothetical protein
MKTALINAARPTRESPENLRRIVGERRLVELALEAAQLVGENVPRPEKIVEDQPGSRTLLTLLTYCYAAGIYASEDIEWACESDAAARYICAKTRPDHEVLRCFRRANRPWIEACLGWVYGKACPTDIAGSELAALVRQKLELAIMLDTATADC